MDSTQSEWKPIHLVDEVRNQITYNADGLVPAIAQEVETGEVLMLAWMNAESLDRTLAEGRMVYWSRSRQELWRKGDTSGDYQSVREAYYDCDGDTLLFKVVQLMYLPSYQMELICMGLFRALRTSLNR